MKKIEAVFLAQRIRIEGSFSYALQCYSSYPAIKDKKFRKLYNQYHDNQYSDKPHTKGVYQKLRKMILETAGLKSFSDKAIDAKWSEFSKKYIDKEELRWELEFKKQMLKMYSAIHKEEPNDKSKELCVYAASEVQKLEKAYKMS